MDEIKAKQQVVEKIKEASKILVTVSDDPSVDALSAALGLTLLLDKQEKYATAIFSGQTPPAIAFLEPEKTFDDTTDSLRDFIIALNKEKADHLRYKVEGESVKIFITPYKTTINQDDLEFSQGDYNVELVIAIGVDKQDNLDKALDNHGQILHDAAIVTLTAGDQTSNLGGIDWHDAYSSSLSEMVTGLAEALKQDKKKSLLDTQIATALLTGIVAETDRFSNEHTTSKVMTVAASLMAAGADQQLIATELQQAHSIPVAEAEAEDLPEELEKNEAENDDDSTDSAADEAEEKTEEVKKDPTNLTIQHEDPETLAELDERIRGEEAAHEKIEEEIEAAEHEAAEHEAEEQAEKREKEVIAASTPKLDKEEPVKEASEEISAPSADVKPVNAYALDDTDEEPTFGGVLNATADQAEEDARRAIEDDQNKTILSHSYIGDTPTVSSTQSADLMGNTPEGFPGAPSVIPGSQGVNDFAVSEVPSALDAVHSAYALDGDQAQPAALSGMGGERVIQPLPTAPELPTAPADLGLPLPPPIPDFSQGLAHALPPTDAPQGQILSDILAPDSSGMAYETTNTVATPGTAYAFEPEPVTAAEVAGQPFPEPVFEPLPPANPASSTAPLPAPTPSPVAPGQFQIPTQQ